MSNLYLDRSVAIAWRSVKTIIIGYDIVYENSIRFIYHKES